MMKRNYEKPSAVTVEMSLSEHIATSGGSNTCHITYNEANSSDCIEIGSENYD